MATTQPKLHQFKHSSKTFFVVLFYNKSCINNNNKDMLNATLPQTF